jgi:hypothetical protein
MKYSQNALFRCFFNGMYSAYLAKSRARNGSSFLCSEVSSGRLGSLPLQPLYVSFSPVAAAIDVPWNTTWHGAVVDAVVKRAAARAK